MYTAGLIMTLFAGIVIGHRLRSGERIEEILLEKQDMLESKHQDWEVFDQSGRRKLLEYQIKASRERRKK
jgi:hypothetical protein